MEISKLLNQPLSLKCVSYVRQIHVSVSNSSSLKYSPNAKLSKPLFDRYLCLPLPDCKSIVEYIWISGNGYSVRSKAKTLTYVPSSFKEIPNWSVDGSLVGLSKRDKAHVTLVPVALYSDPIRRGKNKLALCETYSADDKPTKTNHRAKCIQALNDACKFQSCFGFEQDIMLKDVDDMPFGWPKMLGHPDASESYYCQVGGRHVYGRDVIEAFYRCCLYCGIDIWGVNAERFPAKWEFQTGPTHGIKAADDLWMARYLLARIAEEYGLELSIHPRPFRSWPAMGCHVNFSTKKMRDHNGIKDIEESVGKLEKYHKEFLKVYDTKGGKYNKKRLNGAYEVSSYKKFETGSDRCVSIRIPSEVRKCGKGYFEDRRPAANADPYQVINALVRVVCLNQAFCVKNKKKKSSPKKKKE